VTLLRIQFLGAPAIHVGTAPVTRFRSAKVLALLAYLVLEADRPIQRDTLAMLLWPDYPSMVALRNLSQTLTRLRRALGDLSGESRFLHITRDVLSFKHGAAIECDLWRMEELLKGCESHPHVALESCAECQDRLVSAAALARGELLEGFGVDDSVVFEEWLLLAREFWHVQQLTVLERAAAGALAMGRAADAARYAQRQLVLEPWREGAHQQVMLAYALDEQRAAALVQFERCKRVLATELGVEPSARTQELAKQIREGMLGPKRATPEQGGEDRPSRQSTLSTPLSHFFGREEELETLGSRLRDGGYHILTLTGPGGIGKTRLALEVVRRQFDHFGDGVFFVPLAGVEQVADIPTAIARALHLPLSERASSWGQVIQFLSERHVLLVLDNIEHLLEEDVSWILHMAQASPWARFLVTSRERLNVMAEDLYPLDGLPVPPRTATGSAALLPSVRLFVDRARRLDKRFMLHESNVRDVIDICALVEGLPLGIELASTWISEMNCQGIAEKIRANLNFLAASERDVQPQHRSLRAVFDHSWRLLSGEEQQLLARLSVFRGGFTREAAEQVTGASSLRITRLQHKSLVRRVGADRLTLHELVRQFAGEQLQLRPREEAVTLDAHAAWYLDLLASKRVPLCEGDPGEVVAEILADLDNVRGAWQHATRPATSSVPEGAVRALGRFYRLAGYHEEGITVFRGAAARIRAGRGQGSSENEGTSLSLSRLLLEQVTCALARGEVHVELLRVLDEAKGLAQVANARAHLLEARVLEGRAYRLLGRLEEGTVVLRQVLTALRGSAFPSLEGEALFEMGRILALRNRRSESASEYREALWVQRASNHWIEEQRTLLYLAVNAVWQLDYVHGLDYLEQAGARGPTSPSPTTRLRIANARGLVEAALGNYPRALALHEECQELAHQLGDMAFEIHAFHNLCFIHTLRGDLDRALEAGRKGVQLALHARLPEPEAYATMQLGFARLARAEWDPAEAALTRAWQLWQALDNQSLLMEVVAGLACVARTHHDGGRAHRYTSDVASHLLRHGAQGMVAPFRTYLLCRRVLQQLGRLEEAEQVLTKGYMELQSVAATISDPVTCHAFLTDVSPNRALLEEWARRPEPLPQGSTPSRNPP
jgi:predicted ATPase/DNA-binding SARP family transcriptional activator